VTECSKYSSSSEGKKKKKGGKGVETEQTRNTSKFGRSRDGYTSQAPINMSFVLRCGGEGGGAGEN